MIICLNKEEDAEHLKDASIREKYKILLSSSFNASIDDIANGLIYGIRMSVETYLNKDAYIKAGNSLATDYLETHML